MFAVYRSSHTNEILQLLCFVSRFYLARYVCWGGCTSSWTIWRLKEPNTRILGILLCRTRLAYRPHWARNHSGVCPPTLARRIIGRRTPCPRLQDHQHWLWWVRGSCVWHFIAQVQFDTAGYRHLQPGSGIKKQKWVQLIVSPFDCLHSWAIGITSHTCNSKPGCECQSNVVRRLFWVNRRDESSSVDTQLRRRDIYLNIMLDHSGVAFLFGVDLIVKEGTVFTF